MEKEGDICFEIYDTGSGIKEDKLKAINRALAEGHSNEGNFALSNICRRLKNAFGPEYGLTLESEYGQWSRIRIRLGKITG
jgi:sensor histidine kinase YesM